MSEEVGRAEVLINKLNSLDGSELESELADAYNQIYFEDEDKPNEGPYHTIVSGGPADHYELIDVIAKKLEETGASDKAKKIRYQYKLCELTDTDLDFPKI